MYTTVTMSEIKIFSNEDDIEGLETSGLSSCICIILKGIYLDKPFLLMHHWSGFDNEEEAKNSKFVISNLISLYCQKLDEHFNITLTEDEDKAEIQACYVIGGQIKELSQQGELILSGTEREIAALKKHLEPILRSECVLIDDYQLTLLPFITKADESLTVSINVEGEIKINIEDDAPDHQSTIKI